MNRFIKRFIPLFLTVMILGMIVCAGLSTFFPPSVQSRIGFLSQPLSLGLDLKGGVHLLFEMDEKQFVSDKLNQWTSSLKKGLLDRKDGLIRYASLEVKDEAIVLKLQQASDLEAAESRVQHVLEEHVSDWVIDARGSTIRLTFTAGARDVQVREALDRAMEIIRRRIDALGTKEPSIYLQGGHYIVVEFPGLQDPSMIKDLVGQTAKLTFQIVAQNATVKDPGVVELPMQDHPDQKVLVYTNGVLTGDTLVDASVTFDQYNQPAVSHTFNREGARAFAEMTTQHVGEPFAIILDNKVISTPVIQEPIYGGRAQITGHFTLKQAQDLALLLKSGALPATLSVVEQSVVGPEMGAESIRRGFASILLGLGCVVLLIVLFYKRLSWIVAVSLLCNFGLLMLMLAWTGATLTLPGIAGIILTLGMAADSNILMFESIRERVKKMVHPLQAFQEGFKRAFGTILDANLTTLIPGIVLLQFGVGSVRGFAVTLCLGIISTVFANVLVSRYLFALWMNHKPKKIPLN